MSSMYAKYILEKTQDQIIETDHGFATYRYLDDGKSVYIVDLYVSLEFRMDYLASTIADTITKAAKEKGYSQLLGSVIPSNKNSTASMKVLLAYGMSLSSSGNDIIFFRKDI